MTWRDGPHKPGEQASVRAEQDAARQILRSRIDLSGLTPLSRAVTEEVLLASADLCYVTDLVCAEPWLAAAVCALAAGAPVVADVPMVAAGITGAPVICKADEPLTRRLARTAGIEPAAAAVRLALGEAGPGAVWVVGAEPVAIREILSRGAEPSLVIGMPAGLLAAADAKKALRGSGVPALTNISEKGGPAVAVASCMALLRQVQAAPERAMPSRSGGSRGADPALPRGRSGGTL